jgi:hypothetical protein
MQRARQRSIGLHFDLDQNAHRPSVHLGQLIRVDARTDVSSGLLAFPSGRHTAAGASQREWASAAEDTREAEQDHSPHSSG